MSTDLRKAEADCDFCCTVGLRPGRETSSQNLIAIRRVEQKHQINEFNSMAHGFSRDRRWVGGGVAVGIIFGIAAELPMVSVKVQGAPAAFPASRHSVSRSTPFRRANRPHISAI